MRRRDRFLIAAALVIIVLVGVRIALPSIIKDYVNETLAEMPEYDGSVDDVDLHLWRGAYRIDGIRIVKTGAERPTPFFAAEAIEFSVEWKNLFRGSLVAEGEFISPDLNLVQAKTEDASQLGTEVNWAERLGELFPFRFNTVRVRDGRVTFTAPGIRTEDALTAEHVNAEVRNLTNVVESGKETFAEFAVDGRVLGDAPFGVKGALDPLARQPTFDVNLTLQRVQLPKVNPWLREFIKADAEAGDFELYLELAAAEGKFKGYAKPVMQNVDIYSSSEPEKNPLKRIWEGLVDFAADVLENDEKEQVAARIPFTGTIKNPQTGVMETIVSVLRNAFVSAFARSLEGSISLRDVKENLQGVGEDEKQKKEKRKKDEEDRES